MFTMLDCDQQRISADALFSDRDLLEVGRTRNEGTARGEWGPGLGKEIDEFFYLWSDLLRYALYSYRLWLPSICRLEKILKELLALYESARKKSHGFLSFTDSPPPYIILFGKIGGVISTPV